MWNKDLLGLKRIGPMNMKYATRHWQNQCKRYLDYPSHYKDASIISWLYTEEDGQFDFVCMGNVLEVVSRVTSLMFYMYNHDDNFAGYCFQIFSAKFQENLYI